MKTVVTLFAGGGGKTRGAIKAGYTPLAAVEYDAQIAPWYVRNVSDRVVVGDVRASLQKTRELAPRCDLLLASPPCQQHSQARNKNLPCRDDADVGLAILDYVRALEPGHVIIENVPGYARDRSCQQIMLGLIARGYAVAARVVDFADYGVPQNRRRLIIQARMGGIAWPDVQPWRGWYGAIEDMVDDLPESQFAPWQLARLPDAIMESVLMRGDNTKQEWGKGYRVGVEPAPTQAGNGKMPRAFLIGSGNTNKTQVDSKARFAESPMFTVAAGDNGTRTRAFIVDGKMNDHGETVTFRRGDEPMFTVPASASKQTSRAWLELGRVVRMTPRALARFQTFGDDYELPNKPELACRIVGNALPEEGMAAMLGAYETGA